MKLIRKNWFLVALMVTLLAGYHCSEPLSWLSSLNWLKWSTVAVTMFLMAWPLAFGSLQRTISRPVAPLLACLLNSAVIPLIVWPLVRGVGGDLGAGMMIAAATPCTLASAAVWTRRAGGDDSVAIMVTILTNASCFLVMPFWIFMQTGNSIEPNVLTGTIYNLFFFVVLPIAAAQLVRLNPTAAAWATAQKSRLSSLALFGVLTMVFIGAISMGLRMGELDRALSVASIALIAVLVLGVHGAVFWGGMGVAKLLGLPREQQIAVGFSGSQKTLMIGLTVSISLGMSIIPIVLYHAIQLIVDTIFADWIRETG
jgi:sodium/bile acid cotransporter 7